MQPACFPFDTIFNLLAEMVWHKYEYTSSDEDKISKWTNCQTHTPKYLEAPSILIENQCDYYKILYGR